jgi:hypothetical protein
MLNPQQRDFVRLYVAGLDGMRGHATAPEADYSCPLCGIEWQQHITYRYCLTCGQEDGPGALVNDREAQGNLIRGVED